MPIDVNTTGAALNNSAALQSLFANGMAPLEQRSNQQLVFAFQQKLAQQEQQAAMQRQLASQAAAVGLQNTALTAEGKRQAERIQAEKDLQSGSQTFSAKELDKSIAANTASATQAQSAAAKLEAQTQADIAKREMARSVAQRADMIRLDPHSQYLGIDMAKYDPSSEADNAKLVQDFNAAATPDKLASIDVQRVQALQGQSQGIAQSIAGYEQSPQGKSDYARRFMQNPDMVKLLTTDFRTKWTQAQIEAAQNGDYTDLEDALHKIAKGTLYGRDVGAIQQISAAHASIQQDMRANPSPTLANQIGAYQALAQQRQGILQGGTIRNPQDLAAAFGSTTPLADTLKMAQNQQNGGSFASPQFQGSPQQANPNVPQLNTGAPFALPSQPVAPTAQSLPVQQLQAPGPQQSAWNTNNFGNPMQTLNALVQAGRMTPQQAQQLAQQAQSFPVPENLGGQ